MKVLKPAEVKALEAKLGNLRQLLKVPLSSRKLKYSVSKGKDGTVFISTVHGGLRYQVAIKGKKLIWSRECTKWENFLRGRFYKSAAQYRRAMRGKDLPNLSYIGVSRSSVVKVSAANRRSAAAFIKGIIAGKKSCSFIGSSKTFVTCN